MKIKKGFELRTVMGQSVILAEGNNSDSFGKMIALNSSAAMLWNELKGKSFTVDTAAGILVAKYGIDHARAQADAAYILNILEENGYLED